MFRFPIDGESLIHLHVLAGFHAASAQYALIRIVAVEGVTHILLVRLWQVRALLMFDVQQGSGVMNSAVFIIVIAHRAVEQVVAEDNIHSFHLRRGQGLTP